MTQCYILPQTKGAVILSKLQSLIGSLTSLKPGFIVGITIRRLCFKGCYMSMNSDKYSVSNYFIRVVFSYHKNIDFYVICVRLSMYMFSELVPVARQD